MREKFQAPDIFAKLPYLLLRYHLYFLNVFCYKCPSFPKSPVFQKMPLSPTPWHLLSSISTPGCSHPLKSHFFVNLCTWLLLLSLSHVHLFATPWTATCQASLSFTTSRSLLKLMSSYPTSGCLSKEYNNTNLKRYSHLYVHHDIIYNSQDMEAS